MRYGFPLFLMGALGLAACAGTARAGGGDRVTFDTLDGVTLEGAFYKSDPQAPAKDKNATVLLLHNIDKKEGGNSSQDNWDDLAQALSADGYSVLRFDFRGFGNSHNVNKDTFWDPIKGRHNREAMPQLANKGSPPDTIDRNDFKSHSSEYFPYLVNDITAAKNYLDRHSTGGQANSSNLILVGAGEGATLGAMWMESQMHLQKVSGRDTVTGKYTFDEPEGKDVAAAVWLDISPKLGGAEVPTLVGRWNVDLAGENKVPMAFVVGKDNEASDSLAKAQMRAIEGKVRHDNPNWDDDKVKGRLKDTAVRPIEDSKLTGSKLVTLPETRNFVTKYVDQVIDARGPKDPRPRGDNKMDLFLWNFPGAFVPHEAKLPGEDSIHLVPVQLFMHLGN